MNPSSFEHIVRIQFNALMMTVIKCTVKNRNRQFARRSKREVLFCELSDTKNVECVTKDNYSCDYISFDEYYGAAEPPVRCGESHLSGLTEPLRSL